mmetsp:Transcript_17597/g.53209  ORF Transcript_17597/g.53209 Transcript_17597/m.53209 type:complete len:223 (+) Transcript_17597:2092-2760(+)
MAARASARHATMAAAAAVAADAVLERCRRIWQPWPEPECSCAATGYAQPAWSRACDNPDRRRLHGDRKHARHACPTDIRARLSRFFPYPSSRDIGPRAAPVATTREPGEPSCPERTRHQQSLRLSEARECGPPKLGLDGCRTVSTKSIRSETATPARALQRLLSFIDIVPVDFSGRGIQVPSLVCTAWDLSRLEGAHLKLCCRLSCACSWNVFACTRIRAQA